MDLHAQIVDQQVTALSSSIAEHLAGGDEERRSRSFIILCAKHLLNIDDDDALDALTDGADDMSADMVHVGDLADNEFDVTILQGKYHRDLAGTKNFPETEIKKLLFSIELLFDRDRCDAVELNPKLRARLAEVHSLIADGGIPRVRVVACSNGKEWTTSAGKLITAKGFPPTRVSWRHFSHHDLVSLMEKRTPVAHSLFTSGRAIVENFDYRRVLISKVPVNEIARLFDEHGDILLERNIRRYLGLRDNRVNQEIRSTLRSPSERSNFYFYNNGITATCSKFTHNELVAVDSVVQVEDLQIINGGQTCKTIQRVIKEDASHDYTKTFVLLRLYELTEKENHDALVRQITYATNSQSPVDLGDLRSNDPIQSKLRLSLESIGYAYKTKRDDVTVGPTVITSAVAAEAVMAVWRRQPHAARFKRRQLFGSHYPDVFDDNLNGPQVAVAVLLLRLAENERKRPSLLAKPPKYIPYASHFVAMLLGEVLLARMKLPYFTAIDHRNFQSLRKELERKRKELYATSIARLATAMQKLGLADARSLQQLSATFRRGDLLQVLSDAQRRRAKGQATRAQRKKS